MMFGFPYFRSYFGPLFPFVGCPLCMNFETNGEPLHSDGRAIGNSLQHLSFPHALCALSRLPGVHEAGLYFHLHETHLTVDI